jgi:hypothetical protein
MSQTYRQQSKVTPELVAKDPDNRLLARGPRFRLAGELVRDQALALSGLLVPKIGGDSVRPYMPEGVWDETSKYGNLRGYKADSGEGLYRRTMYTVWKRTAAPPTMLLFDSPSRELCTVKRSRTNTPLQALALLNEVTFVEAARSLAQRLMKEGGATPDSRIAFGYRLVTSRAPDADAEALILLAGLNQRLAEFQASPEAEAKLITTGASKPDASLNPSELAAYTPRPAFCSISTAPSPATDMISDASTARPPQSPRLPQAQRPGTWFHRAGAQLIASPTHFAPKAKRIIYLFQSGAPSQMDLFDPKPQMEKRAARTCRSRFAKVSGSRR